MKKENQDIYGEPITIQRGKIIATIRRPILTEEERARRMEKIKEAAYQFVLETEKLKRAKELAEKKSKES